MKPADFRNATWQQVLTHVTEDMVRVHLAWQAYGPGTTAEVAKRSGISEKTVRPRTTDLGKLGLVEPIGSVNHDGVVEGLYRYVSREEAEARATWQREADFRRRIRRPETDAPGLRLVGFKTVEEAVASLEPAARAELGARLLGSYGHLLKRRLRDDTRQLDLLPV